MNLTEKSKTIPLLMKHCNLNQKEAESFFLFLIYGAYNVNKSMHWNKNEAWYELQSKLNKFILGGLKSLS